jgi:hypothetical protein
MESIKEILMRRDDMTEEEADDAVDDLKQQLNEYLAEGNLEDAYYVCESVGLEPDYLMELM